MVQVGHFGSKPPFCVCYTWYIWANSSYNFWDAGYQLQYDFYQNLSAKSWGIASQYLSKSYSYIKACGHAMAICHKTSGWSNFHTCKHSACESISIAWNSTGSHCPGFYIINVSNISVICLTRHPFTHYVPPQASHLECSVRKADRWTQALSVVIAPLLSESCPGDAPANHPGNVISEIQLYLCLSNTSKLGAFVVRMTYREMCDVLALHSCRLPYMEMGEESLLKGLQYLALLSILITNMGSYCCTACTTNSSFRLTFIGFVNPTGL